MTKDVSEPSVCDMEPKTSLNYPPCLDVEDCADCPFEIDCFPNI